MTSDRTTGDSPLPPGGGGWPPTRRAVAVVGMACVVPGADSPEAYWQTILDRKAGRGMTNREGKSYVRSLLDKGVEKINRKIREEAGELCDALASESDARVVNEAADLLFHALVGLAARELEPDAVAEVIRERHGLSGIDEKAAR